MINTINLLTVNTVSNRLPSTGYAAGAVRERERRYELPPADAYARRLAEEAERWLRYAHDRSRMKPETLVRKALNSLAFSLRHGAHDLAVPSKLVGTSEHQAALWGLVRRRVALGTPLVVEERAEVGRVRLVVSHGDERLGEVQRKHVPWLRPLLSAPFGAGIYLVRVTGQEEGYTLGLNVALGRVGAAVAALERALGTDVGGDGYGADGAAAALVEVASEAPLVPYGFGTASGDGAAIGPDDVCLWRDERGNAHASVEHVVRHSPTGIEWGYGGSGPADLAYSVLVALTDEATAARHYAAFKHEVIAAVPDAGGVVYASDVRAWLRRAATSNA